MQAANDSNVIRLADRMKDAGPVECLRAYLEFTRVMIEEGVNKMDGPDEEELAEDIAFVTDPMNTDCLHDAMMLALSKRGRK